MAVKVKVMVTGSLFHSSMSNNDSIFERKNDFNLNTISQILFDPEPITLYDHGFFSSLFDSFVRKAPQGKNFFEVAMHSANANKHVQILKPAQQGARTVSDILQYYVKQGRGGGYTFDYFAQQMADCDVRSLFVGDNTEGKLGVFCSWFFDSANIDRARFVFDSRSDQDSIIIRRFLKEYSSLAQDAINSEINLADKEQRIVTATNITHNFIGLITSIPVHSLHEEYANISFKQLIAQRVPPEDRSCAQTFVKLLMHIYGIEAAARHNLTFNMFDTDDLFKTLLDFRNIQFSGSRFITEPQKLTLRLPRVTQIAKVDGDVLLNIRESYQFEKYRSKLIAWRDAANSDGQHSTISYDEVVGALLELCDFICELFAMHKLTSIKPIITLFDKYGKILLDLRPLREVVSRYAEEKGLSLEEALEYITLAPGDVLSVFGTKGLYCRERQALIHPHLPIRIEG